MKNKDIDWYNKKLLDIKKRKKIANDLEDPVFRKKLKDDLKREHRAVKRAERQNANKHIEEELNKDENEE